MKKNEFETLHEKMASAWSSRNHTEVLKAFSPDVRYADPLRYSFNGKSELSKFFGPDGEGSPQTCVLHLTLFDEEKQSGAVEYTYEGEHKYHGVVLIRMEGNLISHWREYQHIDERLRSEFLSGTGF